MIIYSDHLLNFSKLKCRACGDPALPSLDVDELRKCGWVIYTTWRTWCPSCVRHCGIQAEQAQIRRCDRCEKYLYVDSMHGGAYRGWEDLYSTFSIFLNQDYGFEPVWPRIPTNCPGCLVPFKYMRQHPEVEISNVIQDLNDGKMKTSDGALRFSSVNINLCRGCDRADEIVIKAETESSKQWLIPVAPWPPLKTEYIGENDKVCPICKKKAPEP